MRIINIVDNLEKVNYGIWDAAISTASQLKKLYQIESELWFPHVTHLPHINDVKLVTIPDQSKRTLNSILKQRKITPDDTIIVTHGCWQFPTTWGKHLKSKGFKWLYVPHGMLEPWSMTQKKLKKSIYFSIYEYPLTKKADYIRAVGTPEHLNLKKKYDHVILIPNGTNELQMVKKSWNEKIKFLFMARLHHKKGLIPLVQAWSKSSLNNLANYELIIAGPDDGEKTTMLKEIELSQTQNIKYIGSKYGEEKKELLTNAHYYILPSHSEGFPTSVLEAMQYGLIPLITEGCNFPEAFTDNKAIKIGTDVDSICKALNNVTDIEPNKLVEMSQSANQYINNNYALKHIATLQYQLYKQLLT